MLEMRWDATKIPSKTSNGLNVITIKLRTFVLLRVQNSAWSVWKWIGSYWTIWTSAVIHCMYYSSSYTTTSKRLLVWMLNFGTRGIIWEKSNLGTWVCFTDFTESLNEKKVGDEDAQNEICTLDIPIICKTKWHVKLTIFHCANSF